MLHLVFLLIISFAQATVLEDIQHLTSSLNHTTQNNKYFSELINISVKYESNNTHQLIRNSVTDIFKGADQPITTIEIQKQNFSTDLLNMSFQHYILDFQNPFYKDYVDNFQKFFFSSSDLKLYSVKFQGYFNGCDLLFINRKSKSGLLIGSCWSE